MATNVVAFDVVFDKVDEVYFAGDEITGKVLFELSAEEQISELLLELKGRARTYWTKHSGKSRAHCSESEPWVLEQRNTCYTHRWTIRSADGKGERTLPVGRHQVSFAYTLPKVLPSSFEGDWGCVRYTVKAILERPWAFDVVTRKGFTVIGLEDLNLALDRHQPVEVVQEGEPPTSKLIFLKRSGKLGLRLALTRSAFTVGQTISAEATIQNNTQKPIKNVALRLKQIVNYRARTWNGEEECRQAERCVVELERAGPAGRGACLEWRPNLVIPAVPPHLGPCKIITVAYDLQLVTDEGSELSLPIHIGTIPIVDEALRPLQSDVFKLSKTPSPLRTRKRSRISPPPSAHALAVHRKSTIQVQILDEIGQPVEPDTNSSSRCSSRTPSSAIFQLYPTLVPPQFKESAAGPVDIADDKERAQFGCAKFTPKYAFYADVATTTIAS